MQDARWHGLCNAAACAPVNFSWPAVMRACPTTRSIDLSIDRARPPEPSASVVPSIGVYVGSFTYKNGRARASRTHEKRMHIMWSVSSRAVAQRPDRAQSCNRRKKKNATNNFNGVRHEHLHTSCSLTRSLARPAAHAPIDPCTQHAWTMIAQQLALVNVQCKHGDYELEGAWMARRSIDPSACVACSAGRGRGWMKLTRSRSPAGCGW